MTITGTCNGVTSSAEVNVTVAATPVPLAVTLGNGKLLWSGQTDTGTVTLNEPAPAGTNITVTWTETGASLPPTIVSAPAGATSVSFPIPVPAATTTYLEATASANGYSITGLAGVASGQVTVFVSDTTSQTSETGTILLRAPAPAQGGVVALFADPATLLSLPASATIPAGSRSTTFNLRAGFVSKNQTKTATLTASYNGTWITEYVSIAGPTGTIGCVGVRCL
jgi:hypothetical protein